MLTLIVIGLGLLGLATVLLGAVEVLLSLLLFVWDLLARTVGR